MPTVEEEIIARLDGVIDGLAQPKTSYEILRAVGPFPPRHVSAVALRRVCETEEYGGGGPGPQGPQGIEGPPGATGAQGPAGAEGAQGVAGPDGATGAQGPQGPQGETGKGIKILGELPTPNDLPATDNKAGDAYIVTSDGDLYVWSTDLTPSAWVDAGQVVGPQGPTGPQGVQGPTGAQGLQGATGPQGEQGIQGPAGTTGIQGIQGIQGPQGIAGAQGATGPSGATVLDLLPPWGTASAAATNLAAAAFNAVGDMNYRRMIDLRGKTKLKVMGRIGGALVAATKLRIQYHTAGNVAVATGDAGWATLATTAGSHTLNTLFYSAELAVPAGAQINDCLVRVGLFDGDGAADPTITTCCLNFYP